MKHSRIPFKYVGVMRQTQTSVHNVSEHITSDIWTEAEGVNLLEEWTGTTRFQILRTTVPEGYGWVGQWKTQKIQKTARPDSIWLEAWITHSKKQKENQIVEWAEENAKLQAARRNTGVYEVLTDDEDYFKVIADARLKLEQDAAPANAVH